MSMDPLNININADDSHAVVVVIVVPVVVVAVLVVVVAASVVVVVAASVVVVVAASVVVVVAASVVVVVGASVVVVVITAALAMVEVLANTVAINANLLLGWKIMKRHVVLLAILTSCAGRKLLIWVQGQSEINQSEYYQGYGKAISSSHGHALC